MSLRATAIALLLMVVPGSMQILADEPENAPKPRSVLPGGTSDEAVVEELLNILASTESEDTVQVVMRVLSRMKSVDRRVMPAVIRACERTGALKGIARGENGSASTLQVLEALFDRVLESPANRSGTGTAVNGQPVAVTSPSAPPARGFISGPLPPPTVPSSGLTLPAAFVPVPMVTVDPYSGPRGLDLPPPPAVGKAAREEDPTLEEVVRRAQSGEADSVIIDNIRTSGMVYHLTAEQLDYLKQNGVHQCVINEMQATAYRTPRRVFLPAPRLTLPVPNPN
jgi:hypothetical protein